MVISTTVLTNHPATDRNALTFALFAPADTSSAFILVRVFFEVTGRRGEDGKDATRRIYGAKQTVIYESRVQPMTRPRFAGKLGLEFGESKFSRSYATPALDGARGSASR